MGYDQQKHCIIHHWINDYDDDNNNNAETVNVGIQLQQQYFNFVTFFWTLDGNEVDIDKYGGTILILIVVWLVISIHVQYAKKNTITCLFMCLCIYIHDVIDMNMSQCL